MLSIHGWEVKMVEIDISLLLFGPFPSKYPQSSIKRPKINLEVIGHRLTGLNIFLVFVYRRII